MNEQELRKTANVVEERNKKGNVFKIVGVVIGIVSLFALVFFSSTLRGNKELKPIIIDTTVSEYFNLKNGEETVVILFASPDCPWCVKYKPIINKVSSDYKLPIYYVNTANMSNDEYGKVLADSPHMTNEGGLGTPLTLIVGNNQEIASLEGKEEYDEVVKFFEDNGVIE